MGSVLLATALLIIWVGIQSDASPLSKDSTATYYSKDFVKDFPSRNQAAAMVFHGSQMYAITDINGCLYRFGKNGGSGRLGGKTQALQCFSEKLGGSGYSGLTFDLHHSELFVAQQNPGSILSVDPQTGNINGKLVEDFPSVSSLATNPITGDIFATSTGDGAIMRFKQVDSNNTRRTTASRVATVNLNNKKKKRKGLSKIARASKRRTKRTKRSHTLRKERPRLVIRNVYSKLSTEVGKKSMVFAPDGTLYVTTPDSVYAIPYQKRVPAPNTRIVRGLRDINGIAISPDLRRLIVTHANGRITEIDLRTMEQREIMNNGTQSECIAFGPDGCIYAAQTQNILRITTQPDGSCPGDLGPDPVSSN